MPDRPRPNILLIHSDQHRYDCLSCHDASRARTPHLDRLAAGGVDFTHAFTPNPVCSPARACLQTGAWATRHGCVTIPHTEAFRPADPALPVMTALLADAGYRVAHVGKFHHETTGDPTDHGAEAFVPYAAYHRWREQQGLPPRPREHRLLGEVDPHITPQQSPLHWQCDQVLGLLDGFAATASTGPAHGGRERRPFLLRWDPPEPHLPCIIPAALQDLYRPADIAPWPSFPDPLENKPEVQRRNRRRWGVDGWPWEKWAPVVGRYLAEIELLDTQVGRLLDALDRRGLADDTLVIYTADHGDLCGGHGMMDKHFVMYDDVMRVPLILRLPGRLPAGAACDAFVSHEIDLARTLLAAAGVDAPESFVGRDLLEPDRLDRPDVFAQYQGTHQGLYSQRMLRDRRWKYVYNAVSTDELYDLDADPGEVDNRVDDPAAAGELHRLRERMGGWMSEIGDPLSPPLWTWPLGPA